MRHRVSHLHKTKFGSTHTEETRRKMEMVCVALVILAVVCVFCIDSKKGKVNVAVVHFGQALLHLLKVRGREAPP